MNPQVQQRFQEIQRELDSMRLFMRSFLSAAELDPDIQRTILRVVGTLKLSDLSDVEDTDSATTGKVLKKTATTWQPGDDIDT